MSDTAALIVAAGRGERLPGDRPKQYRNLAGLPVLRYCVNAFSRHEAISQVQIVFNPDDAAYYANAVGDLDLPPPVAGGATRQGSVHNGLNALRDFGAKNVLIHDGARPIVSSELIDRVVTALGNNPGAVPAIAESDTLKRAENKIITGTVDRSGLWRAQTPQGFHLDAILRAHDEAVGEYTDDASIAEAAGIPVALVEGAAENIKITIEDDLVQANRWLAGAMETRVGTGFDVHRFEAGDHVRLAGIHIAHDQALAGHSDADVVLHAVTDAILGALGAGDIGQHFPPSDPAWRDADSAQFLRHATSLLSQQGGHINHVDITVICERPKVSPHRETMIANLAQLLGVSLSRVSVKATTTEGLGFTGRGEGIAAQAVATIALPQNGDE